MLRHSLASICLLLASVLLVHPARAADLYLSGGIGNSGADGEASVGTDFYQVDGGDSDSSPAFGGTIGLGFTLDEVAPSVGKLELPAWVVRTEFEYMMGRDYEFVTRGASVDDSFFTEVDVWTVMPTFALEVPLRTPISWLFGRVPVLEPMSLVGNVGLGVAQVDLETTDNVTNGDDSSTEFAWQAGVGLSYALTDTTSFQLGWRYLSLGSVETDLTGIVGGGDFELDLTSHEVLTGLRVNFYTAPLQDMHPRHWRLPRVPLPGWLGGSTDEDAPDADAL